MKKQKKQSLLTAIIVILVLVLIMMIASIVYEEVINMSKQPVQNTNVPAIEENKTEEKIEEENTVVEETQNDEKDNEETQTEVNQEYIGEEETEIEEIPEMTTDEKAIDLVKKEWGDDDSVTFRIEKKNGAKYRVAVRDGSTTVLQWYEVDIETWEVSEY